MIIEPGYLTLTFVVAILLATGPFVTVVASDHARKWSVQAVQS